MNKKDTTPNIRLFDIALHGNNMFTCLIQFATIAIDIKIPQKNYLLDLHYTTNTWSKVINMRRAVPHRLFRPPQNTLRARFLAACTYHNHHHQISLNR